MVFDDKTGLFYFLAETLFDVGCFFEVEVKLLRLKLIIFVVKGDFFKIKVTFFHYLSTDTFYHFCPGTF